MGNKKPAAALLAGGLTRHGASCSCSYCKTPTYKTLTRAQAQATAEGATRFSMRGSCVIAHRPSKVRPGEEATCALVQQADGSWRYEGWVS